MQEHDQLELPFEQCQNPQINCHGVGNVEIKHQIVEPETERVIETVTLGWLCQACAMTLVMRQTKAAAAPLN